MPTVAVLMVGLTLAPAEIWNHPATDSVYTAFDPNLIHVNSSRGGVVNVDAGSISMTAPRSSEPTVTLVVTTFQRFDASLSATVLENLGSAAPFRMGVRSPRSNAGYFIVFDSTGILAETIADGSGQATRNRLMDYVDGATYRVAFTVEKAAGFIRAEVSSASGGTAVASIERRQLPALFDSVRLSLSASASGGSGACRVVLRDWKLALPHERFWASKVSDPIATAALVVLGVAGLALLVIRILFVWRRRTARIARLVPHGRVLLMFGGAIAAYLVGNALLFPIEGHPFDFGTERLYAYVARTYGAAQLFYLPNAVSLGAISNGIPFTEAPFPYDVTVAYLFSGIGWLNSLLFDGGHTFSLASRSLEYLIKATNVLFGLGDAALIYLTLRRLSVSGRWSGIAGAAFLFNPAVWFSMSVWGQTHVISLFFVLAAVLAAEKGMPFFAWLALAAGTLTRPQMLAFAFLVGIAFLRRFQWRQNAMALSWAVIVMFVASAPLTLATSPSLPVDVMINNLRIQETGGNEAVFTTVSQSAYSIWPLATYIFNGASGTQRIYVPSSTVLAGTTTYQQAGQIATVLAMMVIGAALLLRRRNERDPGGYIPLVALGISSFLMLLPGLVATHFLLALPFLLLCRRWMSTTAYLFVATIWTITTFVPMAGEMGSQIWHRQFAFASQYHAFLQYFAGLYTWDRFITAAIVANVIALIWLAFFAFRPAISGSPPRPAPAA